MATQKIRFTSFTLPTSVKALLRGGTSVSQTSTTISTVTGTERREVTFTDLAVGVYTFLAYNGSTLLGAVDISIEAATGTYEPPLPSEGNADPTAIANEVGAYIASQKNIVIRGPRINAGRIEIVIGDAYLQTDSRAISFPTNGAFPDLTGASISFEASRTVGSDITTATTISGVVVVANGTSQRVVVPMARTYTLALAEGEWEYGVYADYGANNIVTIERGIMDVVERTPR